MRETSKRATVRAMDGNSEQIELEGLPDLARRISNKIDRGRGMQISADELDLLVAIGANDLIQAKAAEYQRLRREVAAAERAERGRAAAAGQPETPAEALERARRAINRKPRARSPIKRA